MFKEEVYQLIRQDWQLRESIASVLGVSEGTIYSYAKRKSQRLEHYLSVKLIMLQSNKKEQDIFKNN
jgi:predicted DNA-binding protein YlxM (UPF0122 family)